MRAFSPTRPEVPSRWLAQAGLAGFLLAGAMLSVPQHGQAQRRGRMPHAAMREERAAAPMRGAPVRPARDEAPSGVPRGVPGRAPETDPTPQMQRGFSSQNSGSVQGNRQQAGPMIRPNHPLKNQEHLGAWMNQHSNMPLDQQQRALEQEPGFRQLAPEQQQRMRDRLTQLNRMSPQQRQSVIDRTEAMERLSPQQRQQVRSAAGELGGLPPDRRRAVAQAFRGLQSMPADQRQSYMNSPQFRAQYNGEERDTLNHLMQVSPYLPMRQPSASPQ